MSKPLNQHKVFLLMEAVNGTLRDAAETIRHVQQNADPEALRHYGGPDYMRRSTIAVTNIQQAILWLGGFIGDDE